MSSNEIIIDDNGNVVEETFIKSGQLAEILGIDRDMVRYYTNLYEEFLPTTKTKVGKGAHTLYSPDAVSIMKFIVTLKGKGKSNTEIKSMLKMPGINILFENNNENENNIAALLAQNNSILIDVFSKYLEGIVETKEQTILAIDKVQFDIKSLSVETHDDMSSLKQEMEELKKITSMQSELILELTSSLEKKKKKRYFPIFRKD